MADSMWLLEPDVVFLNHGSFGACTRPVMREQQRIRELIERQPMRFFLGELESLLDDARAAVAELVGARVDNVAFVHNATTGVNAVFRSFPFAAGDELIITNHGYNACNNAARFVAERAGARVVVADIPFPIESPDQAFDAVLAAVTPRTRLALIDHVTSQTALVLPVERIAKALSERGVDVLVDGAHGPGMLPLDLDRLADAGVHYYTGNLHKWVCAPKGAAFLHVRRDRQDRVRPAVISHGANTTRQDRSRFLQEFDWVGTTDPSACLSAPVAIRMLASLAPGGLPSLMASNRAMALAARKTLADALEVGLPAPDEMIGSIAAVPLPDASPPACSMPMDKLMFDLAEQFNIEALVPYFPAWPSRLVRISAQAYNEPAHYATLASALRELLDHS